MEPSCRKFLAGRRCFQIDGAPFLMLFGMSPHSGSNYECLESTLTQSGIKLGDFLTADLGDNNSLRNFQRIDYPLEVKAERNFAIMKFPSAQVTKDSTGHLVFKTKDFGPVSSLNQNLPLGSYEIVIKSKDTKTHYDIVLCAEATATAASSGMPKVVSFHSDYEVPRSKMQPNTSSTYEYISSEVPRFPDPAPTYSNTSSNYLELQNLSTKSLTLSELIDNLPTVELAQPTPPTPKPRTVVFKPKPILKVKPRKEMVPEAEAIQTERKMKAFVNTIYEFHGGRWYFLWICDVMAEAVFKLANHQLALGHLFEGVFTQQPSGAWECVSYVRQIQSFIKGSIVYGKVEVTTKISDYKDADEEFKYPHATAKYFGTVIDRFYKVPSNWNGQRVTIQKRKLDEQKEYAWIITGLEKK